MDNSLLRSYECYTTEQKKGWTVFSCGAFAVALAYMIWRAPFGFASFDECFYMSVPYRFIQGAVPFVDEWHGSQLAGFLLYPLMKLFLAIRPDGEGMVLTFRYFFIAVNVAVSIYIYLCGRKLCAPAALIASLMLMLFAPYSIRALSYNSMGVLFVSSACFSAATAERHPHRSMLLCGLFFAAAVLCCPYLLFVFLIYCVSVPAAAVISKKHSRIREELYALRPAAFFAFCAGAAVLFAVFCVFLLGRVGIGELIKNIPYIFSDPEHGSVDILYNFKRYLGGFYKHTTDSIAVILGCGALMGLIFLDRGRVKRRGLYMLAALLLTALYCRQAFIEPNLNYFMFPMCIPGFFAFVLSREKQWKLFGSVFVPGVLYSVCMHFTSNQWYLAITLALTVSSAASVFFIANLLKEMLERDGIGRAKPAKAAAAVVFAVLMTAQLGVQMICGAVHVDYERSVNHLNVRIESGVQKGVLTEQDKAEHYYAALADTEAMREMSGDHVLYFSDDIWLLLSDKKPTAAYSAWLGFEEPEHSAQRVLGYWELHPEKIPENIYVKDEFYYGWKDSIYGDKIVELFEADGYESSPSDKGYYLSKIK